MLEAWLGTGLRSTGCEMNSRSPSYRPMPLSSAQKGAVGQFAFLEAALVTGNGQVEAYISAADNEGRDAEIRRHLKRAPGIGIQIKVAFETQHRPTHKQKYLEIRFKLAEERVQNDPRLWYFLAFYERRQLRLLDPVFLVPSHAFHQLARDGKRGDRLYFEMIANLGPDSHDRWSPYRIALRDLGKRLLAIIDDASLTVEVGTVPLPEGAIVIGRARRPAARPNRNRIARAA
jgi:hypothetical protein